MDRKDFIMLVERDCCLCRIGTLEEIVTALLCGGDEELKVRKCYAGLCVKKDKLIEKINNATEDEYKDLIATYQCPPCCHFSEEIIE